MKPILSLRKAVSHSNVSHSNVVNHRPRRNHFKLFLFNYNAGNLAFVLLKLMTREHNTCLQNMKEKGIEK